MCSSGAIACTERRLLPARNPGGIRDDTFPLKLRFPESLWGNLCPPGGTRGCGAGTPHHLHANRHTYLPPALVHSGVSRRACCPGQRNPHIRTKSHHQRPRRYLALWVQRRRPWPWGSGTPGPGPAAVLWPHLMAPCCTAGGLTWGHRRLKFGARPVLQQGVAALLLPALLGTDPKRRLALALALGPHGPGPVARLMEAAGRRPAGEPGGHGASRFVGSTREPRLRLGPPGHLPSL